MANATVEHIAEDIANFACREKKADTLQNINNWLGSTPAGLALASALASGTLAGVTADKKLSRSERIRRALQGALAGGAIGGAVGLRHHILGQSKSPDLNKINAEAWRNASDTQRFFGTLGIPSVVASDSTATSALRNAPGIASIQSHPIAAAVAGTAAPVGLAAGLGKLRRDADTAAAVNAAVKGMKFTTDVNKPPKIGFEGEPTVLNFMRNRMTPAQRPTNSILQRLIPDLIRNNRVSTHFNEALRLGELNKAPQFVSSVFEARKALKNPAVKPWTAGRFGKYLGLGAAAATAVPMLLDNLWRGSGHPANVDYQQLMKNIDAAGAK